MNQFLLSAFLASSSLTPIPSDIERLGIIAIPAQKLSRCGCQRHRDRKMFTKSDDASFSNVL